MVIVGSCADSATQQLIAAAHSVFLPFKVRALSSPSTCQQTSAGSWNLRLVVMVLLHVKWQLSFQRTFGAHSADPFIKEAGWVCSKALLHRRGHGICTAQCAGKA